MKKKHLLMLGTVAAVAVLAVTTSLVGCKGGSDGDDQGEVIEINPSDFNIGEEEVDEETEEEEPYEEFREGCIRSELTNEWIDEKLENQRPIAVMVDNESTALDHYGVNAADIVYEMMNSTLNARITRLMCIYKDWGSLERVGSIRSTRPTNLMIAAEYNAILIHDGGPFYIDYYIKQPYTTHLSGGFARYSNGKATEFTEYVTINDYTNPNTGKSYPGLNSRLSASNISTEYNEYKGEDHFQFEKGNVDFSKKSNVFDATYIELPFSHNSSKLTYNEETKKYEYSEYGKPHIDPLDNDNVTSFTNVILQCTSFTQLDSGGYMVYNLTDSTTDYGYYISHGKGFPIIWKKSGESGVTHYYNGATGEELKLNTGKIYIALVPADTWGALIVK